LPARPAYTNPTSDTGTLHAEADIYTQPNLYTYGIAHCNADRHTYRYGDQHGHANGYLSPDLYTSAHRAVADIVSNKHAIPNKHAVSHHAGTDTNDY